jgi:hypothetical protein
MNAMDAMAETPPARRRLTIGTEVRAADVEVRVRDTGTGLPADINGKLFAPFVTDEIGRPRNRPHDRPHDRRGTWWHHRCPQQSRRGRDFHCHAAPSDTPRILSVAGAVRAIASRACRTPCSRRQPGSARATAIVERCAVMNVHAACDGNHSPRARPFSGRICGAPSSEIESSRRHRRRRRQSRSRGQRCAACSS